MLLPLLWLCLHFLSLVTANVEKTIFLAPPALLPPQSSGFNLSDLPTLTPAQNTLRTQLHSRFAHSQSIPGIPSEAWFFLDGLSSGSRYEVRICWAAIQPTTFEMNTFRLEDVAENEDLVRQLAKATSGGRPLATVEGVQSRLLLRVMATADYYTMNQTLMQDGLIVDVDLILDYYFLGVAPISLWQTGLHILVVGTFAYFIMKAVIRHLDNVVQSTESTAGEVTNKKTT